MKNGSSVYQVYIIKSETHNKFYTGQTNDIDRRLKDHNEGKVRYTSRYRPWYLVYKEIARDRKSAVNRKKYLKSAAGRRWLKKEV